jgi:hypothetical protein
LDNPLSRILRLRNAGLIHDVLDLARYASELRNMRSGNTVDAAGCHIDASVQRVPKHSGKRSNASDAGASRQP